MTRTSTLGTRQAALEAEAATYTAAAHLGVDDATAEEYAAELAALDQAARAMEDPGDSVSLAEWSAGCGPVLRAGGRTVTRRQSGPPSWPSPQPGA